LSHPRYSSGAPAPIVYENGAWLAYEPEEKLAVAYTTNAKVYPVTNIVRGAIDIYYNKPFQIPTFETIDVSPEVLDKYVGVYSSPEVPVKFTITREGATLFVQPGSQSAARSKRRRRINFNS
jgi:D-alanyl-D-alanine carboxypeptidase